MKIKDIKIGSKYVSKRSTHIVTVIGIGEFKLTDFEYYNVLTDSSGCTKWTYDYFKHYFEPVKPKSVSLKELWG